MTTRLLLLAGCGYSIMINTFYARCSTNLQHKPQITGHGLPRLDPYQCLFASLPDIQDMQFSRENQEVAVASKVPVKTEARVPGRVSAFRAWWPFEGLRREVDRIFEDFDQDFWLRPLRRPVFGVEPFWRREPAWRATPAVDIVEKDNAY